LVQDTLVEADYSGNCIGDGSQNTANQGSVAKMERQMNLQFTDDPILTIEAMPSAHDDDGPVFDRNAGFLADQRISSGAIGA